MICAALEVEVEDYVGSLVEQVDEHGHRLVRRNGRAQERRMTVGSGTVALRAPRVDDRRSDPQTGERMRFSSQILPRYARRSPKVSDVLPVLYLRGGSRPATSSPRSGSCSGRRPPGSRPPRSGA